MPESGTPPLWIKGFPLVAVHMAVGDIRYRIPRAITAREILHLLAHTRICDGGVLGIVQIWLGESPSVISMRKEFHDQEGGTRPMHYAQNPPHGLAD